MPRLTIDLDEEDNRVLSAETARTRLSRAQYMRTALRLIAGLTDKRLVLQMTPSEARDLGITVVENKPVRYWAVVGETAVGPMSVEDARGVAGGIVVSDDV